MADVTREGDVAAAMAHAMSAGPGKDPVDLVVYNAGNNRKIDFLDLTPAMFEDFWRVGCFGGFLVGQEAARNLVPSDAARSCSPAHPEACAASPGSRISPPQRRSLAHAFAERRRRDLQPEGPSTSTPFVIDGDIRRRSPQTQSPGSGQRTRRGRAARHRSDSRGILVPPPAEPKSGLDAGNGLEALQGSLLSAIPISAEPHFLQRQVASVVKAAIAGEPALQKLQGIDEEIHVPTWIRRRHCARSGDASRVFTPSHELHHRQIGLTFITACTGTARGGVVRGVPEFPLQSIRRPSIEQIGLALQWRA